MNLEELAWTESPFAAINAEHFGATLNSETRKASILPPTFTSQFESTTWPNNGMPWLNKPVVKAASSFFQIFKNPLHEILPGWSNHGHSLN